MKAKKLFSLLLILPALNTEAAAGVQDTAAVDSLPAFSEQHMKSVSITRRRPGVRHLSGALNTTEIGQTELFKAACCNLGESFVTNPSVDVNYSDAATGARQIKLLGLSGVYVQMLTENIPNFRGAAMPYALGYVPGPWMKSIQVSKGSASVRNGYESLTGQINVEYLKPDADQGITANLYGDTESRLEANADANLHVSKGLSSELLLHYENRWGRHDGNGDGFQDMPGLVQYNLQNRWKYAGKHYIFHAGAGVIDEERTSGQSHTHEGGQTKAYRIKINTRRYEGYMKHAFILNVLHNTNIALMASGSMHLQDAAYGHRTYRVNEKNAYAQLLFETDFTKRHNLSAGLSLNHDYLGQKLSAEKKDGSVVVPANNGSAGAAQPALLRLAEKETVGGMYAQYTYNLGSLLTAMAGIRVDHSSVYGTFATPRLHLKWKMSDAVSLRASAGKGYRTPFVWAENNYLLASGRNISADCGLKQEEAWNYGASAAFTLPLNSRNLVLNAEYYYTHFLNQAVTDYDSELRTIHTGNLRGRSYSHTFQVDASYELLRGMTLTAAYRRNIVKATYGGKRMDKPLTSKYKGLLSASYKTPLGLWQFDATLQLNGGGRMPTPYTKADGNASWPTRFHAYEQLSAQVTRWFRHFSVYIGGENLTAHRQKHPVYGASDPWGADFEPTLTWGPTTGAMAYAGIRVNFGRL